MTWRDGQRFASCKMPEWLEGTLHFAICCRFAFAACDSKNACQSPYTRQEASMGSLRIYATTGLVIANLSTFAHAAKLEDVAPYPKAEAGFTRQVIHLPKQAQEENFQVEILAGKTLEVDCNRQKLDGILDEKSLQGWGYPFYRLENVIGPTSTMMACPPGSKKKRAFVPVVGDGFMLRYNSKLPVVVYAPSNVEVRYRIWSASDKTGTALQE
jgi:ecotin